MKNPLKTFNLIQVTKRYLVENSNKFEILQSVDFGVFKNSNSNKKRFVFILFSSIYTFYIMLHCYIHCKSYVYNYSHHHQKHDVLSTYTSILI